MVYEYTYDEETQQIRIDWMNSIYEPSIEDSDVCMARVIDILLEVKKAGRIVLAETREYEYDFADTRLLLEIALAVDHINKEKIISIKNISAPDCDKHTQERYAFLQGFLTELKYDPIESYKRLIREIRHTTIKKKHMQGHDACFDHYINNALTPLKQTLDSCRLIEMAKPTMPEIRDRSFYRQIFHPTIRPNFMYTRYVSLPPANAEPVDRYKIGEAEVEIYQVEGKVRKLYHIVPPEFRLHEEEYMLLDTARRYLAGHQPREVELSEPEMIRENLYNIGLDILRDLGRSRDSKISESRLEEVADILARYTAGFGILELLLQDEKIQDIAINAPIGKTPIFVFHETQGECETNIIPSKEDADSWATRFKLRSGRPLDESNPVLDTELSVPGGRARIAAVTRMLSPDGLAFAFRRHRDKPWTFPLFINNKMFDPFSAALIWFIIDGSRTMLIAGTRSSGKSSFLGSCMVQIMPKLRIITLEDTLELPVEQLVDLGYNIERLKSRSVITRIETELPAEEALRTALRLGDSCLIIGEVRSREALALYEAMRIGALANVVAGTIHGESAYGVFDRVVNDLGVPPTSFKATDIIIICNMLKTPDGLHSFRRIVEVTEVRKHWKSDPMDEAGFVDLLEYSARDDILKPTKTLLTGESTILNDIANRVRDWKGNWDSVWENIKLREKVLATLVEYGQRNINMLEAPAIMQSNSYFHIISDEVKKEVGALDSRLIYERWLNWLKNYKPR